MSVKPALYDQTVFSDGPRVVPISRDVISATGPDVETYLQGQLSQDLAVIAPGASSWTFILAPQGKVVAWFRVSRVEAGFLLDVDLGAGSALLARLERFKLRTDATFELDAWHGFAVRGPGSAAAAGTSATIVADASWPGIEGVDILDPGPLKLELDAASPEDLEVLRILAAIPAMGTELTTDTIPAESGVVDRSVSFTKGCYTGQELVARIDSRGGNVPKKLRTVTSNVPLDPGDMISVGDVEVGAVTSAVSNGSHGWVGLAYIKRGVDAPADGVTLAGAVRIAS